MSEVPEDLHYTADHEWIRVGDPATVGITAHAAESLGDIVYFDSPELGKVVEAGDECGEIESVKAVSSVFAPVGGTIKAVNETLDGTPETVNEDPYGKGWLFTIARGDMTAFDEASLLTAAQYRNLISEDS